jgi:hypothetical protein
MSWSELRDWVFGIILLSVGGVIGFSGASIWLWAELSANSAALGTVQDVFFRYSVPPYFHWGIAESVWWRILNSDLPWFAFASGTFLACLGAVPFHSALRQRAERQLAAEAKAAKAPSALPADWIDGHQTNPFAATAARASLSMPFLTARMEQLLHSDDAQDSTPSGAA